MENIFKNYAQEDLNFKMVDKIESYQPQGHRATYQRLENPKYTTINVRESFEFPFTINILGGILSMCTFFF